MSLLKHSLSYKQLRLALALSPGSHIAAWCTLIGAIHSSMCLSNFNDAQ